ncbi:VENN motif pre-toxin domain-containing protein [Corticibacter populi]|nr:VENN motif pre-toxin domain-containing protein [Corticibacter populi]
MVAELLQGEKPAANASAEAKKAYENKVLAYSKLVSGATAAYAGGDAQTAITTSETAVKNNYLTSDQWKDLAKELSNCKSDAECEKVRQEYQLLHWKQEMEMRQTCGASLTSTSCHEHIIAGINGDEMQWQLVQSNRLPSQYLIASDYSRGARQMAIQAYMA